MTAPDPLLLAFQAALPRNERPISEAQFIANLKALGVGAEPPDNGTRVSSKPPAEHLRKAIDGLLGAGLAERLPDGTYRRVDRPPPPPPPTAEDSARDLVREVEQRAFRVAVESVLRDHGLIR